MTRNGETWRRVWRRFGGGGHRGPILALILILLLWLSLSLPLALGSRTLFFRDIFTVHLPYKAFGTRALEAGSIPAFNPTWGLGQPFRGNPDTLPFYPDNLLYLILPFWSAFNLHFVLHWLLAFLAMGALARVLGQKPWAALLAALTYAGCGWLFSALTFYNIIAITAWWPLVLAGAALGRRRGVALGGIACGLALLSGAPMLAALGTVPLFLVAIGKWGWRKGLLTAVAIGAAGLLVALPQVVASLRIIHFTFRGGHGVLTSQAADFALEPARLLELLIPLPWGWPGYVGPHAIWARRMLHSETPFILTLYVGAGALWLSLRGLLASRLAKGWALLALAGLVLAMLFGYFGHWLSDLSFGLFRFPIKFVFWTALALPLLAGWGLDRWLEQSESAGRRRFPRGVLVSASLALLFAAALALIRPLLEHAVSSSLVAHGAAQLSRHGRAILTANLWQWVLALVLFAAILLATAWASRGRRPGWVIVIQVVALAQLMPLFLTDSTKPYRVTPEWLNKVPPPRTVFDETSTNPPFIRDPQFNLSPGPRVALERIRAAALGTTPGVLDGLSYPLQADVEGLFSPLTSLMLFNLAKLDWSARVNWLRVHGVAAVILFEPPPDSRLSIIRSKVFSGTRIWLARVAEPAPAIWWPDSVEVGANPIEALKKVSFSPDPVTNLVVSHALEQRPGGRVALLAETPDRLEFTVDSKGGVVALRRAYQQLYEARTAHGKLLETMPVDLDLLGVVVPPGRHRVVVWVPEGPAIAAGVVAGLALLLLLTAAILPPRSRGVESPERDSS